MINEMKEKLTELSLTQQQMIDNFTKIIDDMGLEELYKDAGIVYYAYKTHKISLTEIKDKFSEVFNLVLVLEKLDNINYSKQEEEAENLRKMFFAITKDIRIIMLKIALVVTEIRYLPSTTDEHAIEFSNIVLSLYAPLAARLGLSNYKTELEETAFKILQPDLQAQIQAEVDNRFHKREPIVERLKKLVASCMDDLNIKGKVYGRKKHIYSIYKKLKDHSFDNIYDLIAVRAIVNTVPECYALLGRLHSEVEPLENRFKDYIAIPKPNGYQSLHTTVKFEGFPVEVQIRTEEMHRFAEYGVAAHWIYKEKRKQDSLDMGLSYFRLMMDTENISVDELANSLNEDIYGNDIFVQTPKGKVIYLPSGSTPIDFAYSIHSEIGNKCVGAKVNGKMVPTNSPLHNGDTVEIITSPNSKGPSRDWLKFCKTSSARSSINAFFKKNMKEENIHLGKTMLENAIKEKGYSTTKLLSKQNLDDILAQYNLSENEFYAQIGTNALPVKSIANKLANIYQKQIKMQSAVQDNLPRVHIVAAPDEKLISVKGLNNILMRFANCCHPMYGDDIVGFVSAGRGIIIHRSICPNVSFYNENRLVEVGWKPQEKQNKKSK